MAIFYHDTMIANINSRFSGEVVELVVSGSVFNSALLPNDEILLKAYGNTKLSTLANSMEKKQWYRLTGLHILLLLLSIKKNCLENGNFFRERFPQEEIYDEKKHQPPSLQDIKDTMETSYVCIFPEAFMNISWRFQ